MRTYTQIHEARLARTLSEIQSLHPQNILELGCFPPEAFLLPLRSLGYSVTGICSSFEPVNLPQVTSLNIEVDKFIYPDNSFDLVLLCEVIEHMTTTPPNHLLSEIYRVLKPDGHILVTTPNQAQLKNLARKILRLPDPAGHDHTYSAHHHEYTLNELIKTLQKVNLSIRKAEQIDFYTPFRSTSSMENPIMRLAKIIGFAITSLIPTLRDSLLVVAQKNT
jgi:2-polyprenyl-3-methyl-5-hydroxy-6-metoxy-1,4-benzoquinol methylase